MNLTYRTRRTLTTLGIVCMVLILLAVVIWAVWLLWLDRYVVYTRDGAVIDFSVSLEYPDGELAQPPAADSTISIYYNEGENAVNTSTELAAVSGYYADADMLRNSFDLVESQIHLLPADTPVMIDMKDATGYFYYSTSLGKTASGVDMSRMTALFSYMQSARLYTIARIPSFRDYLYALDHDSHGLIHSSGRYVYSDSDRIYWLDPTNEGVLAYLMQIVSELKALGFDEVVFDDFNYPDTREISFSGDREAALASAAQKIVDACMTTTFAVSFTVEEVTFPLPEGRTRIYLEGRSAGDAKNLTAESGFTDPNIHLVFVTEVNDTRFDDYSVLRPITAAQLEEED